MELSERYIQMLEKEGFANIEEKQIAANESFSSDALAVKTTFFVTDGTLIFNVKGVEKVINATERMNIPANIPYSMTAGPAGAIYMFGEKEADDC